MKTVFLSDAHLLHDGDHGYQRLVSFVRSIWGNTDSLVVAGDLFDFWFCDEKNLYPGFRTMVDALLELQASGVDVSLIEGNHDFFMERSFGRHGIAVFPDEAVLERDGKKIYVSHGDFIDRRNRGYLLLRRFLRSSLFFSFQKRLPTPLLWRVARISSRSSRKYRNDDSGRLVEVMKAFALEKMGDGMDAVVLGHSHQPLLTRYNVRGRKGTFALLGDWITHYSYLSFQDGRFVLKYFEEQTEDEGAGAAGTAGRADRNKAGVS